MSVQYLGQVIPTFQSSPLSELAATEVAQNCRESLAFQKSKAVRVWVASENKLKVEAAETAVKKWLASVVSDPKVEIKKFNAESKIHEQPVGVDETKTGAMNRLRHLKEFAKDLLSESDTLNVFVSMENGIMQEEVDKLQNPEKFLDKKSGKAWVDRCYVIIEVSFNALKKDGASFSKGVTAPFDAVQKAEEAKWNKTAGSFIEQLYGFDGKNWHLKMAGISRVVLMRETIASALGMKLGTKIDKEG